MCVPSLKMFLLLISLLIFQNPSTRVSSISITDKTSSNDGENDEYAVRKIDTSIFADPNALLFPDDELYQEIITDPDPGLSTRLDTDYFEDYVTETKRKVILKGTFTLELLLKALKLI